MGISTSTGPGLPELRNIKGLLDDPGHILHVSDEVVVLRAGARDADDIGFLKGIVTDQHGVYLPGENDEGHRIHVSRRNARHRVRRTGTGRDEGNTHSSRGPGVAIGCVDRGLLVPSRGSGCMSASVEGVGNVEDSPSRIAEKGVNALQLQRFNKYLCPVLSHLDPLVTPL